MLRSASKLLLVPVMAFAAAGALLLVDVSAADAATTSAVRVSGNLKVRSAPTNNSTLVRTIKNKAKVSIDCRVTGQYVRGSVRKTAQWDRLVAGQYIPHANVVSNAPIPVCTPPAPVSVPAAAIPAGPTATMTNAQFLATSAGPAQQSQRETRVPASVTLAQAILESGWGRSSLSTNDRNFFGMKCFSQGTYANGCHVYATNECTAAGVCYPTSASFRTYDSILNSIRDHGHLLASATRYAAAFKYVTNPNQFAVEIQKGGYATDPQYATKLASLMTKYNLYQYDVR
jgi:flagellum-specific peptidoglycan hydrolase FlgJ